MRLTQKRVQGWGSQVILHKTTLYERFVEAHELINNQNREAIKTIAEYNFYSGQHYAYLKILQYLELGPGDKSLSQDEGSGG